jgi:sec-independent protein translocase protein TatB
MEFFGIGILELMVIAVLALIVVGPERLPEVMVKVARFIQDFRAYSANITGEFSSALQEMQAEFKDVTDATNESLRSIDRDINAATQGSSAPSDAPSMSTVTEATNGSAAVESDEVATQEAPVEEPAAVSNARVASLDEIRRRVLHSSNGVETNGAGPGVANEVRPSDSKIEPEKPEA